METSAPAHIPEAFTPPSPGDDEASDAFRLAKGFEAFAAGDMQATVQLLRHPVDPRTHLEDWRLFVLAESARALGNDTTPEDALATLIEGHPDSPVRPLAIQRITEIAAETDRIEKTLYWVDFARAQYLPREQASAVERLVWELGIARADRALQEQAGRRLAVEDPLTAEDLEIEAFFTTPMAGIDWSTVLDPSELQTRASNLIDADRSEAALDTLDLIPEEERDFDWFRIQARALTRDHRGREALEALASLESSDPEIQAEILWERALAARDASKVRRGRTNLSEARRQEMSRHSRRVHPMASPARPSVYGASPRRTPPRRSC